MAAASLLLLILACVYTCIESSVSLIPVDGSYSMLERVGFIRGQDQVIADTKKDVCSGPDGINLGDMCTAVRYDWYIYSL